MGRRILIEDVVGGEAEIPREPPPKELGRNLVTLEDCERWLLHPDNWVRYGNQIVVWDGPVPRLTERFARRLLENPQDRPGFFSAIVRQQYDAKHPKKDVSEEIPKGEG